uniref:Uncharacterized protein n=1 Tax=Eptatretus burgeri TaxID=7764 RepID=A0A8C4R8P4_EPTBU
MLFSLIWLHVAMIWMQSGLHSPEEVLETRSHLQACGIPQAVVLAWEVLPAIFSPSPQSHWASLTGAWQSTRALRSALKACNLSEIRWNYSYVPLSRPVVGPRSVPSTVARRAAILTHENTRLLNDLQLLRNPKDPCDIDISPMQNTNENSLSNICTQKLVESTTIRGPVILPHGDKIAVSDASTQTNHGAQLMDVCGLQVEDSPLQLSGNITTELQQNWIQQMALMLQDQIQKDGMLDTSLESHAENQKPAVCLRKAADYLVTTLNDEVQRLKRQLADENVSCQQAEQAASRSTEVSKNNEPAEALNLRLNALEWVLRECQQMQKHLEMTEVRAQEALQNLKLAETEREELWTQLKTMEENCAVTLSQRRAAEEIQEKLQPERVNVFAELERRNDKASIEVDSSIGYEDVLHCTAGASSNGWRERAERAEERLNLLQDSIQREFSAMRFHTSSEVLGYQDQLQESHLNAKRHEDKAEELKKELVDKDSEICKLKNEIKALEVKMERLNGVDVELNSERVAKSALENECSALKSDVQRLEEVEKEGKWQRKDLQERARQAEKTADNLHSEVQELKETMGSMSDRLVELLRCVFQFSQMFLIIFWFVSLSVQI